MAEAAHDANPHRQDEPYRQALVGIYARLAATMQMLAGKVARACAACRSPALCGAATSSSRTWTIIARSLATHGAGALAERRLVPLRRAVEVFGFHLASLDLRQNADVHEAVIGDLLARAGVAADYTALPESARVALLARELATPRPLYSPHLDYAARTAGELAILDRVRRRFTGSSAPWPCPTTSSPSASRCPICSKWACC